METNLLELLKCKEFQWDPGNSHKNWIKHRVSSAECEQIFFNQPLITGDTASSSPTEARYYALGQTDSGRQLFVVFTIRTDLIRVISARPMSRRERKVYSDAQEETDPEVQE
ncbi:MAG: BrnT family toxin [Gemmatimonadetes bacterium]|nr:BrnT family toxin [Gemmatimonadota bacterium]